MMLTFECFTMYTFLIMYPYATQFSDYILKTFEVKHIFNDISLSDQEISRVYQLSGYKRTLAEKKIIENNQDSHGKYRIFLIKGHDLTQILQTKRNLRRFIQLNENLQISKVHNYFHSLDTLSEQIYMVMQLCYPHGEWLHVLKNIGHILNIY